VANTDDTVTRRALFLIDFQYDFLSDDGNMPVDRGQVQAVVQAARFAIGRAQGAGDLIIKIGNEFRPSDIVGNALRHRAAIAGSPGADWDPRVDPEDSVYVAKWKSNAFCNPKPQRRSGRASLPLGDVRTSLCDCDCESGAGSGSSGAVAGRRHSVQVQRIQVCSIGSVGTTSDATRCRIARTVDLLNSRLD
jgi:hypothetical protein